MKQRKYSIAEIDEMRKYLSWMASLGYGRDVEERLRTYMLNGTDPSELKQAHEDAFAAWHENQRVIAMQMRAEKQARGEIS